MKLSPQEKLNKKARDNLKLLHNRILSAFSFKQIKSWTEVYSHLGLTKQDDRIVDYDELKQFLAKQKEELETRLTKTERSEEKPANTANTVNTDSQTPLTITKIPHIPWQQTILARTAKDEFNDCTVLALSSVLDIPYDKAHEILSIEGRKSGKGLRVDYLSEFLRDIGFELQTELVNISIQDFISKYPTGKFFVRTDRHAFAIKDGTVYDVEKPNPSTQLKRVYKWMGLKAPQPAPTEIPPSEKKYHNSPDLNYGLVPSPNEKAFLYWFQKKASKEILDLIQRGESGVLLLAGTGTGKTFITYAVMRRLLDANYHESKTYSHIPYVVLSKSTIIEQHDRVARNFFNITPSDCEITNIETLRSKAGELWVQEKVKVVGGEEVPYWEWKKNINPCVIFFDESQGGKNKKAKQSQIIYAYNNLPKDKSCLVCISATPFTRVIEAKAFAVSTRRNLDHLKVFPKGAVLSNETWPTYAAIISAPTKPEDYNQSAVERLMMDLEPWVVRVRGVRPQFDAINRVRHVQFSSIEEREFYEAAIDRFMKEKAKLDAAAEMGDVSGICYLTILLKYAMAAEFCHARHFARDMYEDVSRRGKAAVAAIKFKQTLIEICMILMKEYGVPRDKISLIWGGGQTQLTKKQKAKSKIKEMEEKFKEMGISVDEMLSDTGLDDVEDRVLRTDIPDEYRLGKQTQEERQKEIDKFQRGDSLYCLYTLKAGGVGLSLHHTDELTEFKCRRKESGYAYEEDIPRVPVRPRTTKVCVSYNAIELVQGVGRVPRLTSLSATEQDVCCFAGTVEVDMGRIYSQKLRCLSAVVKQRESWQDIIFGSASSRNKLVEDAIKSTSGLANDESSLIDEGDSEDEEEDGNGD